MDEKASLPPDQGEREGLFIWNADRGDTEVPPGDSVPEGGAVHALS
jgi:hypothetical protein